METNPDPSAAAQERVARHRLLRWTAYVGRHPQLAIGAVVSILVAAQVQYVARGDPEVVRGLIAYVDVPRAALAIAVYSGPLVLAMVVPYLWTAGVPRQVAGVATVIAAVLAPVWILAFSWGPAALIAGVVYVMAFRKASAQASTRSSTPEHGSASPAGWFAPIMILIVLLTSATYLGFDRPWVTSEVLGVDQGEDTPPMLDVGYVLGTSGGQVAVLWDSGRNIWLLHEEDVWYRQPCSAGDSILGVTALRFLLGGTDDLSCSEVTCALAEWDKARSAQDYAGADPFEDSGCAPSSPQPSSSPATRSSPPSSGPPPPSSSG